MARKKAAGVAAVAKTMAKARDKVDKSVNSIDGEYACQKRGGISQKVVGVDMDSPVG